MSRRIDFSKFIPLFSANEEFSITESQYKKNTGRDLPKNPYYLAHSSALSEIAKMHGFSIEVNERTINFKKK